MPKCLARAEGKKSKVWWGAKLKLSSIELALIYYHGMPSTAYFLVSSDSSSLAVIPSVISRWDRKGFIGLSVPPPTPYVGRGAGEVDHTLPLMTGG